MKKFFAAIFLLMTLCSVSYGATSEDMNVYMRQDVFDAKMEALLLRIEGKIDALSACSVRSTGYFSVHE